MVDLVVSMSPTFRHIKNTQELSGYLPWTLKQPSHTSEVALTIVPATRLEDAGYLQMWISVRMWWNMYKIGILLFSRVIHTHRDIYIYIHDTYICIHTFGLVYIYTHNVIIAPVIPFLGNRGSLIHILVTLPLMKQHMFLSGIMDAQSMYNMYDIWYIYIEMIYDIYI